MIYPPFLAKGNRIGLCAPSNSLKVEDQPNYDIAMQKFHKMGFDMVPSARTFGGNQFVSGTEQERAQEFCGLWNNPNIDGILSLAGGEFMMQILPHLVLQGNPKWFLGFSDNTILHHVLLTWLDTASLYGYNFKYFGQKRYHKSVTDTLQCLLGQKLRFESYEKYQDKKPASAKAGQGFRPTKKVEWHSANGQEITLQGRMIGGCVDVLAMFLGTPYDKTKAFVQKYEADGMIWFLESCDLTVPEIKRTLWQMKHNGWFEHVKGFVFGRPRIDETVSNLTYKDAVKEILQPLGVPIIFDADFGHKPPAMPIINGALATWKCQNGKGWVEFSLK